MSESNPLITVAVPLLNEQEVLPEFLTRLEAVIAGQQRYRWEVLLVDDGSKDKTWSLITSAAANNPVIRGIRFARNFGHQAALSAALDEAQGDATVLMDGDLQDEPEVIPRLLAEFEAGSDIVYAVRARRQAGLLHRAAYFIFYRMMFMLSDTELPLDSGDFSLLSKRVTTLLRSMPERHRFLRGLRAWVGFPSAQVETKRPARAAGRSKYTLRRLVRLAADGLLSFSLAPLRWTFYTGGFCIALFFLFAIYAVYAKYAWAESPSGFTAITLLLVLGFGIQFLCIGVVGEYVGRIFEQVKLRPLYVVQSTCGPVPPNDSGKV